MNRRAAALGTAAFFILAPGAVVVLVPYLLTGWRLDPNWPPAARILGVLFILAGLPIVLSAFARFATEGVGTPAPIAPTQRLVVGGPYRYVRNPMYVSLIAILIGQSLLFASLQVAGFALLTWLATFTFVKLYEEPTLTRTYGEQYQEYRRNVPGWLPRLTPWIASLQ